MIKTVDIVKGFKTPEARWARFGPYYAMFPVDFAFKVVEKYSKKGDFIIDPFAGRCSSIYAGGVLGRQSLGIEINPVGWLYGSVKLRPADNKAVIRRLSQIYSKRNHYIRALELMPEFYRICYCDEVLKFLLAARKNLDWRNDSVDATLMAILLVYLHGKLGEGLSNQMRMTKAMGPNYSVNWWKKHHMASPPSINPFDFMLKKVAWRYEKGTPNANNSRVIFGDSTIELEQVVKKSKKKGVRYSLLFTSPPYCDVTDYYADQWLRLWLLGGPQNPKSLQVKYKNRFISKVEYYNLVDIVFGNCADLMAEKSTIYVRTDAREFTLNSTFEILMKYFPKHIVKIEARPFKNKTQTEICGNKTKNPGEVDIILTRK
jgi:DNA modification methylase